MRAVKPLAMWTVRPLRFWSSSSRVIRITNGELDPAALLSVPALNPGENSGGQGLPFAFSDSVKLLSEETVLPFQPVSSACGVNVPQVLGAVSGAPGPLSNATWMLENGNCGLLSNVVEI